MLAEFYLRMLLELTCIVYHAVEVVKFLDVNYILVPFSVSKRLNLSNRNIKRDFY